MVWSRRREGAKGGAASCSIQHGLQPTPLGPRTVPDRVVLRDVSPQLIVPRERREQLRPSDLGAETPAQVPEARAAQQPLDRVHLRGLEPHEVAPPRERLAQPHHRARRHVHDGAIDPAPQAVAELEGIAPVTLLGGAVCLEPHLVGIDHARRQAQCRQLPGHEERHRATLQRDRGARPEPLRLLPALEARRGRRHLPLRDDPTALLLNHEDARLAVDVQSHVAFHRAALLLFGAPSRLTPWSTANRIAAEGSPSSLLRLSAR
jgi:hypothetical protein